MPEVYFLLLHDMRVSLLCQHSGKEGNVRDDVSLLTPKLALERIFAPINGNRAEGKALQ